MYWKLSSRFDKTACKIADRHYSRQKVGTNQFVSPGRCVVLIGVDNQALWCTSWPEFSRHQWKGAWINTLFRNEGRALSSALIIEAIACTLAIWPTPPEQGIITFIDRSKVRGKKHFGLCYRYAGFKEAGYTKVRRLLCLQLLPENMPSADYPLNYQKNLIF